MEKSRISSRKEASYLPVFERTNTFNVITTIVNEIYAANNRGKQPIVNGPNAVYLKSSESVNMAFGAKVFPPTMSQAK